MHREVRPHSNLPQPPGCTEDEALLMGRLQLPPSIPVSKDGEEGALVYNLGLLQSNADSRPERYHAPPNRTIDRDEDFCLSFHYATSTPKMLSSGSSSSCGITDSKVPSQTDSCSLLWESAHDGSKCAYDSAPGSGRTADCVTLRGSHEVLGVADDREVTRADKDGWLAAQKQRSSSAEGVRRIINKYSFLRNLSRKHTSQKTSASNPSSQAPPSLPLEKEICGLGSVTGVFAEVGSPMGQQTAPWELPPNYVDMIFIKDSTPPAAMEKEKDASRKQHKQQPLKQQHLEQQQQQSSKVTTDVTRTAKTTAK